MAALSVLPALAASLALAASAGASPPRVVSLDFCADQFVLALADREQILAVSAQADDAHSALRARAGGLPQLRDAAEEVLALQPDLIVRSYGGDARTLAFYDRLGLPLHQIGFANDFNGVRRIIREAAAALEQQARGDALIAQMDARLAGAAAGGRPAALYLTPAGATSGSGTLMDAVLTAGGADNAAAADGSSGWRSLPLEALAFEAPDLVVTAFLDGDSAAKDGWALANHPVFRRLIETTPRVDLDGAHTACGTWLLADAAAELRAGVQALERAAE